MKAIEFAIKTVEQHAHPDSVCAVCTLSRMVIAEAQGDLFASPPEHFARASDPSTSLESAHALGKTLEEQKRRIAVHLRTHPGQTAREIDKALGVHAVAHKRLRALEREGRMAEGPSRLCAVSGRRALTWIAWGPADHP